MCVVFCGFAIFNSKKLSIRRTKGSPEGRRGRTDSDMNNSLTLYLKINAQQITGSETYKMKVERECGQWLQLGYLQIET